MYEPKKAQGPAANTKASPPGKTETGYHGQGKPERKLTRWESMKRNRKSKARLFGEMMMERSGKKTGRWDYASGQVIDPDKVVLGHETAVEFKPG